MVPGLRRQQSGFDLLAAVQVLRLSVGREDQPQRQLSTLLGDRRRPLALHGVHYSGADPKPTSLDHLQVVSMNSIGVDPPSNTVTATTAEEGGLLNQISSHNHPHSVSSGPPKSVRVEAVSETELRVSWQVRTIS